jgi:hypothetical protein
MFCPKELGYALQCERIQPRMFNTFVLDRRVNHAQQDVVYRASLSTIASPE